MLLIDGLREDYLEWSCPYPPEEIENYSKKCQGPDSINPDTIGFLDHKNSKYKGKRMTLLNKLAHDEPMNTFLAPMRSEMPTVTTIRVRSMMTGSLNSYIEVTESFGG